MFARLLSLADPFRASSALSPSRQLWPFLKTYVRRLRSVIATSLLLSVVSATLEVWLIGYAGRLVDLLAASRPDRLWTEHGVEFVIVALLVLLVRPVAKFLREGLNDITLRPNLETMAGLEAHRHVLRQSVGWFRNDFAGRIVAQVRQAGRAATGAIYSVVHTLAYVIIYIAASVVLMAAIDARLLVPLLVWIALYLMLMAYIVPRFRAASERLQAEQSALTGMLVDTYGNIDTIKLFARADAEDRGARERFEGQRSALFGLLRFEVTMNSAMASLGSLLLVGIVGYAIVLWAGGNAPLGIVAVALALSFQITGMAEWLLDAVSNLFGALGGLRESLKTVGKPLEIVDAPDATELKVSGGAIVLRDVGHHYGRGDGGLEGLSVTIAAGEKIGLVGRSGSGKSTLVNLCLRFFEPEAGSVAIDGQDISRVTQESLRRQIAMVTQEATLLHRSIRDNIAYGRPDLPIAAIEAAARKAQADRFIPTLRDQDGRTGYDAHVGERGIQLSGGQRQRIALARAILKDAPILMLDEATSALDSEVEAAIQDTLYEIMENKTVIAIAHRLSTIARMDRIVVLDEGRVAEEGTHDTLLAAGGIYARLWQRQAGGFLGVDAGG